MKRFICAAALAVAAVLSGGLDAYAVKARQDLFDIPQPDGTVLTVRIVGDERSHVYLTVDGYPLVSVNDVFYYAVDDGSGHVVSSGIRAVEADSRSEEAQRLLSGVDARGVIDAMRCRQFKSRSVGPKAALRNFGLFPGASFPSHGEQKSLVLLVEFDNVGFLTDDAPVYFDRLLNSDGYTAEGATGSARQYFIDNSGGVFEPVFDVFGPVRLSQPMSYYGANNDMGQDVRPHEMVLEACRLLDDQIDFSEYDRDGDGVVDNVFVFYAGKGEATGGGANSIWPHSASITDFTPGESHVFDGVALDSYACTNEWVDNHSCGIGTFCHEFSHVLGLPDLYSVNYNLGVFSPGNWSLMDHGSYNNDEKTPAGYSVFERYALGWIAPQDIRGACDVALKPVGENDGAIIQTYDEGEFFLLENRQQTGWDTYLPGHGMLVWHVDYLDRIWQHNIVNDDAGHQYVDIEEADGVQSKATVGGDPFPGDAGVTEINDDTTPSLRPWSGRRLKLAIGDIAETDDGIVTFSVSVPGSGLSKVMSEGVSVRAEGKTLRIDTRQRSDVKVFAASGVAVMSAFASSIEVELPAQGIYLVEINGEVSRIAVR